ncbi:accessory gene regulator ArgB-like protein [Clostridium rectalis]|uniref:accessory gene regulator ArgB-like protein n=1 Tax=Clostridium rectalis TaxID=2040295 RepID=UPI0013DDA5CF|nr:accessory gene regulator B family protein [Clostridium rectalis]
MSLVERISEKIGCVVAKKLNLDEDNKEVIVYGAFNLIQTTLALLWVIVFGLIFKVLVESLVVTFVIAMFRKRSGGVHASSPIICIIVGAIIAIGFGLIVKYLLYNMSIISIIVISTIVLAFAYFMIYKFVPVDSKEKPITNIEIRESLKKSSFNLINIFSLFIIVLIFIGYKYKNHNMLNIVQCMYLGIAWQAFTLSPVAHIILKKEYE